MAFDDNDALRKTTRINVLYDFYGALLTEKQQTFLKCYFQDDYSLGEIAAEFRISRQAVYEHLKRAELALEEYEAKLCLADRHERLAAGIELLESRIASLPREWREPLSDIAAKLRDADEIAAAQEPYELKR